MPKILSEARQYELMVIFGADKSDDVIAKQLDTIKKLITDANGKILLEDVWGRRDLAYKIKGQDVGYYVVINFKGDSAKMKELRDILRIDQSIIRSLLIKVPDDHIPTKTTEADLDFSKKVKVKDEKPVPVKVKEEPVVVAVKKTKKKEVEEVVEVKEVEEVKEVVEEPKEEKEEKKPVKKEKKKEEVMDDLDRKLKAIMDDTDIDISI
ncbi:MAG: 30S ribosomal protein S6 [Candidatus Gracilibacteria bacterium]